MEIKTKFNIGETVFFLLGKEVVSKKIESIDIKVERGIYKWFTPQIVYNFGYFNEEERYCFHSKEELLKSL